MKKLLLTFVTFLFSLFVFAQDYVVQSIGFNPPNSYTEVPTNLGVDDLYSEVIDLEFDFEFYGNTYNQVVIGTNGVLVFDVSQANGNCPWLFETNIPNPTFPIKNGILGPYHDIDVSVGGEINYGTYGTIPNRRFVVNFYEVPSFSTSCNSLINTAQLVIYETTNNIEVFMESKEACPSWNQGRTVVGIINTDGSEGLAAPNRNTFDSPWEASQEAWRFSFFDGVTVEAYNATFSVCDTGNGGIESFDLDLITPEVIGNQSGVTVTYHSTFIDANNGVNALPNPYINSSNPEVIYARVEDNQGLFATSEVTLEVISCVDNDGDGIPTMDEDLNGDGYPGNDDTDNDGIPNYLDSDDDNDWVETSDEITGIGAGLQSGNDDIDTDNDGILNYLDNDDDGDGLITQDEDYNGNGDPKDDDLDNDDIPDFLDNDVVLSVPQETFENSIIFVPNPVNNDLTVQSEFLKGRVEVTIYSMLGSSIQHTSQNATDGNIQLNLSSLETGMYFVQVNTTSGVVTKQIIKQ